MNATLKLFALAFLGAVQPVLAQGSELSGRARDSANPILPGYFADPSIVQVDGTAYIYATLDPWGGETLGCWESDDFYSWTFRELNWPTKDACTSFTSKGAMVWAPSVVQGADGKFYMYVSVGSEVWAGVADHPRGPWQNMLGDRPLIPENFRPGFHMIDAEAFIDDDGQAYLYWGSGWNWTNGKCWAVKLAPDMKTFVGEVHDITPSNYFEAPLMVKRVGRYFLMYSNGKTTLDTYQVHYAVGNSPFGPFKEAANSPVLKSDHSLNVLSPGHHTVFGCNGQDYILYHRHSIPFDSTLVGRQVCVDRLEFDKDGTIRKVVPTHRGPELIRSRRKCLSAKITASSQASVLTGPECVLDGNYASRWSAAADEKASWLQLDFGKKQPVSSVELRPEFAWKPYRFHLEYSADGNTWNTYADFTETPAQGSPVSVGRDVFARFLRIVFAEGGTHPSLFEWNVY